MQVKTKNLAVAAVIVVLTLAMWYVLLYSPMAAQTSKAKSDANAAQDEVASLQQKVQQVKPTGKEAQDQQAVLAELQAAIPDTPALSQFLRQSDVILRTSGAAFQTITPSTGATTAGTVNLTLAVSGSEGAVNEYVARLMGLPRLVVIDGVTMTATSSNDANGKSSGSGPVFASTSGPTTVSAQITARLFTSAVVAPATPTASTPATPTK